MAPVREVRSAGGAAAPLPVVSVITPSLNQGRFIGRTIASVLAQAGPFRLDYVIVDGGSTDGTLDALRAAERALRDRSAPAACTGGAELRWVSAPDRGQADAVNKGFALAHGEILGWLNADDCYRPDALRTALEALARPPAVDFVYGDCDYLDAEGRAAGRRAAPPDYRWRRFAAGRQPGLPQPAVFVRRAAALAAGPLDVALHYTLDQDWFVRVARGGRGRRVPFTFAAAHRHGAAKTADPLRPEYAAEMALLLARHGGRGAFGRAAAMAVCRAVREGGAEARAARDRLREACRRAPCGAPGWLTERSWTSVLGQSYALLAVHAAEDGQAAARPWVVRLLRETPCAALTPLGLYALAKASAAAAGGRTRLGRRPRA